MGLKSHTIIWKGLSITVDVYEGTTASSGPDPDSIENVEVEIASESDLAEYLMDEVYDKWIDKLWASVEEGCGSDGRDYDSERKGTIERDM